MGSISKMIHFGQPLSREQHVDTTIHLSRSEAASILLQNTIEQQPNYEGTWGGHVEFVTKTEDGVPDEDRFSINIYIWKE